MHIAIMGGTGFIGAALSQSLVEAGHEVLIISRRAQNDTGHGPIRHAQWKLDASGPSGQASSPVPHSSATTDYEALAALISHHDAVINLAGANIADKRWTQARKKLLISSRVDTTAALSHALLSLSDDTRPHTVLQASAVGYYGSWAHFTTAPICHEYSHAGTDFLAHLCQEWEAAINAEVLSSLGTRVAIMRFAPVLAQNGGMLAKLLPFFRLYLGGPLGSGQQPLPWIHRHDVIGAILHLLAHPHLHGPFNFTAPQSLNNQNFVSTLAHHMQRPSWLPVPTPIILLAFGEMAEDTMLRGQIAPPERLLQSHFKPRYANLSAALEDIMEE